MQQVIMTVGLPASGKSTWAKKWVLEKIGERKRVNRDDLRLMVDAGEWSPENEKFIMKLRDNMVLSAVRAGKSIVIDDTNLRSDNFTKMVQLIEGAGLSAVVMEKPFPVELEEAVRRDIARGQQGLPAVGEKVIKDMWSKYIGKYGSLRDPRSVTITSKFSSGETIDRVDGVADAVICDLDGTLAKMGDRSPFDASRCDELDLPNWPVIDCVKAMYLQGVKVIFMSGREDKDREATERFISKWCTLPTHQPNKSEVIPHDLFMRATGDQRNDGIIKRELFDAHIRGKFNVKFCLDDRNRVVDTWREMGLTCFQVAPGSF